MWLHRLSKTCYFEFFVVLPHLFAIIFTCEDNIIYTWEKDIIFTVFAIISQFVNIILFLLLPPKSNLCEGLRTGHTANSHATSNM